MIIINQLSIETPLEIIKLINHIKNLLDNKQIIRQVFFYGPAVLQAHNTQSPKKIINLWRELKDIPLVICPNSAVKRKVYNASLAQEYKAETTLDNKFNIGSLAEFFDLASEVKVKSNNKKNNKILIIINNNLTKPSMELEEALDFILMAASLEWKVSIVFKDKGMDLFESQYKYLSNLFESYDINIENIYVFNAGLANKINQIKSDCVLTVEF